MPLLRWGGSLAVASNGEIEVCKARYGPCVTIPWQERPAISHDLPHSFVLRGISSSL